jgi:hypothetical protein
MTLRIRSLADLPDSARAYTAGVLGLDEAAWRALRNDKSPAPRPERSAAAELLRRERLREERERLVLTMLRQLEATNLAQYFVREYRFSPDRRFRLDLFAKHAMLGIELHGGIFSGGRHITPKTYCVDRAKMNLALELGIRVLEYTADMIRDGSALAQIERVLRAA